MVVTQSTLEIVDDQVALGVLLPRSTLRVRASKGVTRARGLGTASNVLRIRELVNTADFKKYDRY